MSQIERVSREISEVAAGAGGWQRVHHAQAGIAARRVVQQLLHLLRRQGSVLGTVLSAPHFVRLAASLLSALLDQLIGKLLLSHHMLSALGHPLWLGIPSSIL